MKKSISETVKSKVLTANEKFSLFSADDRILVGFSGGADSMTLLCVLLEITDKKNVRAFHVNHMLRGKEADADEDFCRCFCNSKDIPFSSVRVDVASASNGSGTEEKARDMRYSALISEARRTGCSKIALAHTASDNLETVIFNLSRGAGLSGMRGIRPKRAAEEFEIIRPLILCTRDETEGYANENSLPFCTDKTNSDTHYTRNFIRHKIVPLIKEINPAVEERISVSSGLFSADEEYLSLLSEDFIDRHGIKSSCDVSLLTSLPPSLFSRVMAKMYETVCKKNLEAKHISDIAELVKRNCSGARLILPGTVAAVTESGKLNFIHEYNYLELSKKSEFSDKVPFGITIYNDSFSVLLSVNGEERSEDIEHLSENAVIKAKTVIPIKTAAELTVRNRHDGDKYIFGGMTRTLKKLISSESREAKRKRPVFCDGNGIVWFPQFRIRDDIYKGIESPKSSCILYYFEY